MILPVVLIETAIVFVSGVTTESTVVPAIISGAFLTVNSLLTFWLATRVEKRDSIPKRRSRPKKKNR